MGHDADPAQIEPVGIPASLDRHVGVIPFVRVTLASTKQKPELVVVQIEHAATKFGSELGSPRPMFGIGDFADPS